MKGLYLREKLSTDLTKYSKSKHMKAMIQKFAATVAVTQLTDEECEELEGISNVRVVSLPGTPELDRESSLPF